MKKMIFATVALAALCLSFTKEKTFTPSGTIQINDTLFADETEISNFSWQEFEYWTKAIYGANSKEHIAVLPDTLVWREKLAYNEPYVQYYYRHPAYKDYPVVGISYEQAIAYCKWRTERVKTFLTIKEDFVNHHFEYRLPSKAEWEKLAETSSFALNNNGKNEKGQVRLNCINPLPNGDCMNAPYPDVTAPVKSYEKNFIGLYNMLGNVAEMVKEKGICKGGSWRNRLEECRVGKDQAFTSANSWVGFRCVCIVKKSSNS